MNKLNSNKLNFNINTEQGKFEKLCQFIGMFICYFSCLLTVSLASRATIDINLWFNENYYLENEIGLNAEIITITLSLIFGALANYLPIFLFYLGIKVYFGKLSALAILRLILFFLGISIAMPEIAILEEYDSLTVNCGMLGYFLKNFLMNYIGESGVKITSIFLVTSSVLVGTSKKGISALLILCIYIYTQKINKNDLIEFSMNNLNSNALLKHILATTKNNNFFMSIINNMQENEYVGKILRITRKDNLSENLINFLFGNKLFLRFYDTINEYTDHLYRITGDTIENLNNYALIYTEKTIAQLNPDFKDLLEKFFYTVSENDDENLSD